VVSGDDRLRIFEPIDRGVHNLDNGSSSKILLSLFKDRDSYMAGDVYFKGFW